MLNHLDVSYIPFFKYQGAGNDFVMIDSRAENLVDPANQRLIAGFCDRKFGVGADGLIILRNRDQFDFEMLYFNADGLPGSMCGNGGRCAVAFASQLGMIGRECRFLAVDGPHQAISTAVNWVELQMIDVNQIEKGEGFFFMNTGSPHYVEFVPDLADFDVYENGRNIRYSERFRAEGTNVNFVTTTESGIDIATYERGVENETLACGTGVTAAAIAFFLKYPQSKNQKVRVRAKGGDLEVRFSIEDNERFTDIWLCGPAERVFEGRFYW